MHSVSDLTTFARRTKGDVPPSLVGASTTVVGNKMYLFGGRLVSLRKMVADMYEFDLQTYIWTKIEPKQDEDVPGPRYFHSADAWNEHLVIFGGMGYTDQSSDELCVLSDVRVFSLKTLSWLPATPVQTASAETSVDGTQVPPPRARYAHLSSITSNRLFIIGGQNLSNDWLDDIHVYDLPTSTWVMWKSYQRHCGTYRSVAVCAAKRVRSPSEEQRLAAAAGITGSAAVGAGSPPPQGYAFLGPVGARFLPDRTSGVAGGGPSGGSGAGLRSMANHSDTAPDGPTPTRELFHLPYSCEPTDNFPNDVFIYSNYNFTDVRRELEVLTPQPNHDFDVEDRSTSMGGSSLPPGLRFPTGAILGHHLVIAGTYLAHSYQSFSIWALDLVNMTWSRIDPGATLSTGSWSRGVLWETGNRFLIFGNREGNLVEDYNRRLLSWDHVAYIDLEAFGIYQPPELSLSLAAQELGLAALEEGSMADFELVCDDGRKISCSRRLLEDRWSWFRDRRSEFVAAATRAMDAMPNGGKARGDVAMPDLPGALAEADKDFGRPDPRLTPRAFHLSEPYPVTLAFLQWMYAQALITKLQHAPPILSALLLLATTYRLELLEKQVKHAMHRALNAATSVGVYEVATLCDCQSLQIRALKVVMSSSRQRSSARPRHQGGASGGPGDDPSRPRGMSDAPGMQPPRNGPLPRAPGSGYASPQAGPMAGQGMNGYAQQHGGLRLAITMPSDHGHSYDTDDVPHVDPEFKFGVTTPYNATGAGAAFFDTNETLPSAVDQIQSRGRPPFQPRRKDSSVSGTGSDSGSSATNMGRFAPPPIRKRDQTLRPTTADSAFTDVTERTLIQSEDGKMAPSPISAPNSAVTPTSAPPRPAPNGNVDEARMKRLLHELDSIGLTDDMTIGRTSQDIDDWAASSSVGHGGTPPLTLPGQKGVPLKFTRPEDLERLQQMNRARNWQAQMNHAQGMHPPSHAPSGRAPYPPINGHGHHLQHLQQPHRNFPVDAPHSASPSVESDDTEYYGGMYPDSGVSPGMFSPQHSQHARMGQFSPQAVQSAPPRSHAQHGRLYSPVQARDIPNSAAFPMPPPRGHASQPPPPQNIIGRAPRRPGTAGNEPPVSYYNDPSRGPMSNPANRSRFGSDQNLRDRYLSSQTHGSSMSGSQGGLSPISPASAPAMTISSSRTNSTSSGLALETPLDGNSPSMAHQQPAAISNLQSIQEKMPSSTEVVITTPQARDFANSNAITTPTSASTTQESRRRPSVDAALALKTSMEQDTLREKGARSPAAELALNNPFLGGGSGFMFGGMAGWSVKEKEKEKEKEREARDPPPYRMHSPPSASGNPRTNSLRAGSVGGRSDASGSSFGDGVPRSEHSSKKSSTPAVSLATAFVKDGVIGMAAAANNAGPPMSKAERAAEKARLKAEKAAQKAEEAKLRVEEERMSKLSEAELKKKRKEEKTLRKLQMNDMGMYGINGMVRFNA